MNLLLLYRMVILNPIIIIFFMSTLTVNMFPLPKLRLLFKQQPQQMPHPHRLLYRKAFRLIEKRIIHVHFPAVRNRTSNLHISRHIYVYTRVKNPSRVHGQIVTKRLLDPMNWVDIVEHIRVKRITFADIVKKHSWEVIILQNIRNAIWKQPTPPNQHHPD